MQLFLHMLQLYPPPSSKSWRPALASLLSIALVLALVLSGHAARADTTRNALGISPLEEVLTATRTDLWVEGLTLAQGLELQLSQRLKSVRRDLAAPVFRTVTQQFSAHALSVRFRQFMAARAGAKNLAKVLAFYRSALGRKYAQADQQVRVDDTRAFLRDHPLTPARRALLERWVDDSFALERYTAVVVTPAVALERAFHAFDPRLGQRSARDLIAPMHSQELRKSVIEHAAVTLQDFSDAELSAIARFEASAEGRTYRTVELDALRQVLEEAFASLTFEMSSLGERVH